MHQPRHNSDIAKIFAITASNPNKPLFFEVRIDLSKFLCTPFRMSVRYDSYFTERLLLPGALVFLLFGMIWFFSISQFPPPPSQPIPPCWPQTRVFKPHWHILCGRTTFCLEEQAKDFWSIFPVLEAPARLIRSILTLMSDRGVGVGG